MARNTVFFHSFVASKAGKVRSDKRDGAEDRLPKTDWTFSVSRQYFSRFWTFSCFDLVDIFSESACERSFSKNHLELFVVYIIFIIFIIFTISSPYLHHIIIIIFIFVVSSSYLHHVFIMFSSYLHISSRIFISLYISRLHFFLSLLSVSLSLSFFSLSSLFLLSFFSLSSLFLSSLNLFFRNKPTSRAKWAFYDLKRFAFQFLCVAAVKRFAFQSSGNLRRVQVLDKRWSQPLATSSALIKIIPNSLGLVRCVDGFCYVWQALRSYPQSSHLRSSYLTSLQLHHIHAWRISQIFTSSLSSSDLHVWKAHILSLHLRIFIT